MASSSKLVMELRDLAEFFAMHRLQVKALDRFLRGSADPEAQKFIAWCESTVPLLSKYETWIHAVASAIDAFEPAIAAAAPGATADTPPEPEAAMTPAAAPATGPES
jgi:hypothetical protein